ncbi:MAG: signal peptidase II [Candidatus Fimadaptatus sp.]
MFYAVMVTLLLAADQLSKIWAARSLATPLDVWHGVLAFNYAENRGAAFGMMQNMQPLFIIMSIVFAVAASIYLAARQRSLPRIAQLGGWLAVTGAIGNMIDRAVRGYVVDFIYVYAIDFPIFNIADVCLTLGAALVIIYLVFMAGREPGRAED